jgi:hypothetical protein
MALAAWTHPQDPLLIQLAFPWLWLVCTVLALRYGTLAAFGSVGLMAGGWVLQQAVAATPSDFPSEYFMGGLVLSLIAGEFSDIWTSRLQRVREANVYLNERLESLTRRHYLLKLSHERLEQDLLVKPLTLRDSLMALRRGLAEEPVRNPHDLPQAATLLNLLSQNCQLDVASLHSVTDGRVSIQPVASLGEVSPLNASDPLVTYALDGKELCHIQTDSLQKARTAYLVAAPLLAADGRCFGILVVERLPFLSLNPETLQFLSVILGYYSDSIGVPEASFEVLQLLLGQECPVEFGAELLRLDHLFRISGIASSVAALVIHDSPLRYDLAAEARRQRRQMDVIWDLHLPDRDILLTVMPLDGDAAVTGYFLRTEKWLKDLFGCKQPVGSRRDRALQAHRRPAARRTAARLARPLPAGDRFIMAGTNVKLGAAAVSLEAGAVALVLISSRELHVLSEYFTLHAAACACITPLAWSVMPARYQQPRRWVLLMLYSLCFFIPVLGLLGFAWARHGAAWLPRLPKREESFEAVATPHYELPKTTPVSGWRSGRVRQQISDASPRSTCG